MDKDVKKIQQDKDVWKSLTTLIQYKGDILPVQEIPSWR